MRRTSCAGPALALGFALAFATRTPGAASTRPLVLDSPEGAVWLFDSLLASPHPEAARVLAVGSARDMFDVIRLANEKLMPYVDSTRSHDTVLQRLQEGGRAALKVGASVVFKRPFMGLDSLASVQVVHCLRLGGRWRIAAFQELADGTAPFALPAVADSLRLARELAGHDRPAQTAPGFGGGLFPVSTKRLPRDLNPENVTRLTLRVRLRRPPASGQPSPLAALTDREPPQRVIERRGDTALVVEVSRQEGFTSLPQLTENLGAYLASTPYLDLGDTALQALVKRLTRQAADTQRVWPYVRAVYDHLVARFDFKLGATLFGTSREALARMQGDCSEAAMLTAALLRAKGIPTRIALGFASVGGGVFIGHAWCEAYLGDETGAKPGGGAWVGVDPALRELPAGVTRVRLLAADGQGDLRVTATNLVLGVLNNLDIEMLKAWTGKRAVVLVPSPHDPLAGLRFFESMLSGGQYPDSASARDGLTPSRSN